MDMEVFFKRVYTVAFRLTGEEEIAAEIATKAISHTFKELNEDFKITDSLFQLTIIELIKIFLNASKPHYNRNLKGI